MLTTHNGKVYQMPINLETINSFYNTTLRPFEVADFLKKEIAKDRIQDPKNFEEKAISMIGRPLYEAFIKGYTKKQWGCDPRDMSAAILKRLPFRTSYNESYFFDRWQGIPLEGYGKIFEKMLSHKNIDLSLNTDYFDIKDQLDDDAIIIYSGPIDRFFDYKFGKLEWRSLDFEQEKLNVDDYQGTSVMNYSDESVPYTRIHEPLHLHPERTRVSNKTFIVREYSRSDYGEDPYYPISDDKNKNIAELYKAEANKINNVIIGGRLGDYKYYDMHHTIKNAFDVYESIKQRVKNG